MHLLRNIVSMLGLGVGIDYALLAVSRFRGRGSEALPRDAAAERRRAGHTVAVSGISVVIGAADPRPSTDLRSIAIGGCW